MTNNHLRNPHQYIDAINRSDYLLEEKSKTPSHSRAFGAAAMRFVTERQKHSEYLDLDTQAVRIIGMLDNFIAAEKALSTLDQLKSQGKRVMRSEKEPYLRTVIQFDHAIRELIDTQPTLNANDIVNFIESSSLLLRGKDVADYATQVLRMIMSGMQQEIAAEQALWTIDGVEDVIHATEDEELQGIDLKVMYLGEQVNFDIKSSEKAQDEARSRLSETADTLPIWTGVKTQDMRGAFRASPELVATIADRLEEALNHTKDNTKQNIA